MPRREHLDLRNGIILTFLAIIVVLYSKLLHQNLTITSNTPHEVTLPNNQDAKSTIEVSTTTDHPLSAYETEITHYDGLIKYTRTSLDNAKPNLLILLLTKDDTSWGHDVDAPPRTFHDFLTLLEDTKLDLSSTSLALWTSSPEQYALFRTATTSLPLARLSVFLGKSLHCLHSVTPFSWIFLSVLQQCQQPSHPYIATQPKESPPPSQKGG